MTYAIHARKASDNSVTIHPIREGESENDARFRVLNEIVEATGTTGYEWERVQGWRAQGGILTLINPTHERIQLTSEAI